MLREFFSSQGRIRLCGWLVSAVLWVLLPQAVWARTEPVGVSAESVALSDLPKQAVVTYERIVKGGPFPHDKDGTVFGNREKLLPPYKRGYYREYTVSTPGSRDRGARRIVCGGLEPMRPVVCYYTSDHYASFRRILPDQPQAVRGKQ